MFNPKDALIQKLAGDAIKQLNPKQITSALVEYLRGEINLLKGDANHNGVVDGVEIEKSLRIIAEESAKIAGVLEAAHSKK